MINYFTYDGTPSRDFGVYISGHGTFNSSVRAYNMIAVAGKNGDDIGAEKRFNNVTLIYDAFIAHNFNHNAEGLRNFLLSKFGYKRLVDTYHPDEYRLAVFDSRIEFATTQDNRAASFQLAFNCKPQRYLFSGEQVQTFLANGTIENPTLFASKPLLRIYGTGTLGIGNTSLTIDSANEYTDIDCEIMEAYKDSVSCNGNITINGADFPSLPSGASLLSLSSGITRVDVTPRWYIL